MRARAPGKLVLSGAYSVLWGAPALVTAVDRYVIADTSRLPDIVTPEVAAAIGQAQAPWFDASRLRSGDRKLGLGSSAAIVVASLAAAELQREPSLDHGALCTRVFPKALLAHRQAQGGGSGIDVAASAFGGTLRCLMDGPNLSTEQFDLPHGTVVLAYADQQSSSTSGMVTKVKAYAASDPHGFSQTMQALRGHAQRAASAREANELLGALRAQVTSLSELGDAAEVPIVPMGIRRLAAEAFDDGVVVMPSGAGGGDVVLCVGQQAASETWGARLEQCGLARIELAVGARGVQGIDAGG